MARTCSHWRIFFLSAALCVSALSAFRWLTSKLNAEFAEAQRAAEYLFSTYLDSLVADSPKECVQNTTRTAAFRL